MRRRLVENEWTVTGVVEPALIVEGRDMQVIRLLATRAGLRAHVVVLLACEDGDSADRWALIGRHSGAVVSKRVSETGWKILAEVRDTESARAELESLRRVFTEARDSAADHFELALVALEKRGWQIDREKSATTFFDDPGWHIRAARAGEHLELDAISKPTTGPDRVEADDLPFVTLTMSFFQAFANVLSRDHAERLVLSVL
jgi:hypothetical protein